MRYACISHDKGRQFGRCGACAVMRSKKLKAIAVRSSGTINVALPDKLEEFRGMAK